MKKIVFLSYIALFLAVVPGSVNTVFAAGTDQWVVKNSMPTARIGARAAALDGYVYIIGGESTADNKKAERYNPATDTWTTLANLPGGRKWPAVTAASGRIYVIGGDDGGATSTVYVFDPVNNSWTTKTNMPDARAGAGAVAIGYDVYVIGGHSSNLSPLATVECYNTLSDTWSAKADMPTARTLLGVSVLAGEIYAIGGSENTWGGAYYNVVEHYNPVTNRWISRASMSVRRTMLAVAASGNKIYAIGGWNDSDYSGLIDVVEEYSVYNNSWATKTNLNYPVSESAIAAVNGRIYIAGGNESSLNGIPSNRMLMYYPFLDSVSLNYQNAIPVMQSNTTPLGIVSVSSIYSSSYDGWKAFDGEDQSGNASRWISNAGQTAPQWISYQFSNTAYITGYYIFPEASTCANRAPKNWKLQGSNDNANWTVIDSQNNVTINMWDSAGLYFNINTPGNFKYYRLYVTATNGSPVVSILRLKLMFPEDIIIPMTSNTTPEGKASSSSNYSDNYLPWKAFDGNDESGSFSRWISDLSELNNPHTQWISYEFSSEQIIRNYYILPERGNNKQRAPMKWQLLGSKNGTWYGLDHRDSVTYWSDYGLYFCVANPGAYKKYTLEIAYSNYDFYNVISICRIKFLP